MPHLELENLTKRHAGVVSVDGLQLSVEVLDLAWRIDEIEDVGDLTRRLRTRTP